MSPARRRMFTLVVVVAALGVAELVARLAEWRSAGRRAERDRAHYSLEAFTRDGVGLSTSPGNIRLVLDPTLGYRLGPSRSHGITVNARGLRGAEVEAAAAPGTLRVLVVGGSTAFGWGAESDDLTPPALLAPALAAAAGGRRVEVLNGGVPGYTAWQEAGWVGELVHELRPDLVVSLTGYNDLEFAYQSGGVGDRVFAQVEHRAASAYRLLPTFLHGFALTRRLARSVFEPSLRPAGAAPPLDLPPRADRQFTDALRVMATLSDGRLLVALQPSVVAHTGRPAEERARTERFLGVDEASRAAFRAYAVGALERQRAALRKVEALGARTLDLSTLFQGRASPVFTDAVHVTEEGNRLLAGALARAVADHPAWSAPPR